MKNGAFVVCPTSFACGVNVATIVDEAYGLVVGRTPNLDLRVEWSGVELRHHAFELVVVDRPMTLFDWVMDGNTIPDRHCIECSALLDIDNTSAFDLPNMCDDCYEEQVAGELAE
jgi:hypothetical protein